MISVVIDMTTLFLIYIFLIYIFSIVENNLQWITPNWDGQKFAKNGCSVAKQKRDFFDFMSAGVGTFQLGKILTNVRSTEGERSSES